MILVSMRADRTPFAWDEGSVICISSNLQYHVLVKMPNEGAIIHNSRPYLRVGVMAASITGIAAVRVRAGAKGVKMEFKRFDE